MNPEAALNKRRASTALGPTPPTEPDPQEGRAHPDQPRQPVHIIWTIQGSEKGALLCVI